MIIVIFIIVPRHQTENPEKNLSEQSEEPTKTLTDIWPQVWNQTWATLVGGERNHQ